MTSMDPFLPSILRAMDITVLLLDAEGRMVRVLGTGSNDPLGLGRGRGDEGSAREHWELPPELGMRRVWGVRGGSEPIRWIGAIHDSHLVAIPVEACLMPLDAGYRLLILRPLLGRQDSTGISEIPLTWSGLTPPMARMGREDLQWLAFHDPLTGLPGRRLLDVRIESAVQRVRAEGGLIGLAYLDLDGFGKVNEVMGHDGGDRLLQEVASDVRTSLRAMDILGRVGGDEFVAVLGDLQAAEAGERIAHRMGAAVERILPTSGGKLRVTASVGLAFFATDGRIDGLADAKAAGLILLQRADRAMYQAKRLGPGRVFVEPDLASSSADGSDGDHFEEGAVP
jgi:diguanylate cyclase (GGDEF)-like protein